MLVLDLMDVEKAVEYARARDEGVLTNALIEYCQNSPDHLQTLLDYDIYAAFRFLPKTQLIQGKKISALFQTLVFQAKIYELAADSVFSDRLLLLKQRNQQQRKAYRLTEFDTHG